VVQDLSPRRRRARQRRLDAILDAAMAVVSRDGFDALTMTRLAAELDLSVGALYRYFPSKDALVVELQAIAIERIHSMLGSERAAWRRRLMDDAQNAALSELCGAAAFYRELAQQQPRIFRLLSFTLADPRTLVEDEQAARMAPAFLALLTEVSDMFRGAAALGALQPGDALERTVLFWSSLHGVMLVSKLQRLAPPSSSSERADGLFDVTRLTNEMTAALLRGWGADAERVERALDWVRKLPPRTNT
jgi:AcrR family transcriptional regulator